MKNNKGFTLIELLVVIAIIGLLTSVVLAALNRARNGAADASIQQNLASIRSAAPIYLEEMDEFGDAISGTCTYALTESNVFSDSRIRGPLEAALATSGQPAESLCYVGEVGVKSWVAVIKLRNTYNNGNDDAWCVDSSGNARYVPTYEMDLPTDGSFASCYSTI